MEQVQVLMGIIKQEVLGHQVDMGPFLALSEEAQQELAELSRKHAIAQLLGDALANHPETQNLQVAKDLLPDTFAAVAQVEQIEYERKRICRVLEQEKIPYIQLKGSRIRPYYPEPWMRTSCDIDILVQEEDAERAAERLEKSLNARIESRNYHDISLYSEDDIMLELHFSIQENNPRMDPVLDQVWQYSQPVPDPDSVEFLQSNEFFLFHLLAHMAYHFLNGGCGIRPFLDLLVLKGHLPYHEEELQALCRLAGLECFCSHVFQLIDIWFDGKEHTPITRRLEEFLLKGGVFGTLEQNAAIKQNQNQSKYALVKKRIFATSEHLSGRYPYLKNHKWLLPYYQVKRWVTAVKRGRQDQLHQEWTASANVKEPLSTSVEQMLRENGLL